MDGIEKRPAVKALIEKGKAAGKLTTQEIDTVIVDMDLDIEDLDKLYESIEAQNIEIIDAGCGRCQLRSGRDAQVDR